MFDAQAFFSVPLVDMAALGSPELAGILMPEPDIAKAKIGITEQFLSDAETYHGKYTDTAYFRGLIQNALARADFAPKSPLVLDLGSGSGNSVFPLLELFADGRVVATDLSPNLLAIMERHAATLVGVRDRLAHVCVDACSDYLRPGAFDLVVGAAILHHLIDPRLALRAAIRVLRPGGLAIFFEPFENGHAILRIAYTQILEKADTGASLAPELRTFLGAIVEDWRVRTGSDKSADIFRKIDDKWLFTRSYIEAAANELGFSATTIYPIHRIEEPFTRQTEVFLKLGLGAARDVLPDWAWEIIGNCDRMFSPELKTDLLIEGAILLRA
jgi:SAM-dependent methyltransferase